MALKLCPGCGRKYSEDVWLHPELGICSICWSVHVNSKVEKWDGKEWVDRNPKKNKRGIEKWV